MSYAGFIICLECGVDLGKFSGATSKKDLPEVLYCPICGAQNPSGYIIAKPKGENQWLAPVVKTNKFRDTLHAGLWIPKMPVIQAN